MSIINQSIKKKVEKALVEYLKTLPDLTGLNIYEGSKKQTIELPSLIIFAPNMSYDDEVDDSAGFRNVNIRMGYEINADDTEREDAEDFVGCLLHHMEDLTEIKTALNMPEPPAIDSRAVKGLHIHDLYGDSHASDQKGRSWIEEMEFSVMCEEANAF